MELKGVQRVPGSRDHVWAALNNPDVLRQCIPGCESVEKLSETEFTAKVLMAIGPVKARFGGKIQLTDLNPPGECTIVGEGSGGAAGFGRGRAKVLLTEPEPGFTEIAYDADLQVGGKLAQVGARLIDSTAKKLTLEFFNRFATAVPPEGAAAAAPAVEGEAVAAPVAAVPPPIPPVSSAAPTPVAKGNNYLLWGAAAVVLVVLVVWLSGAK
jgi:carbon monoxide dehydrogenase subunit G